MFRSISVWYRGAWADVDAVNEEEFNVFLAEGVNVKKLVADARFLVLLNVMVLAVVEAVMVTAASVLVGGFVVGWNGNQVIWALREKR